MKIKKYQKKLVLNKETIAHLNTNEMSVALGGADPVQTYVGYTCDPEMAQCDTWWVWVCTSTCYTDEMCVGTASGGFGTACQCPPEY